MNQFDLTGKTAIVTGASRGLGLTFARALARAGADVAVTSRDADRLRETCDEIAAMGRRAVPLPLDVRDEGSIRRMVDAVHDAFGQIDILVNNAGCNVRKPAADVTWEDWNVVLDTNLRGPFFVAQSVARHMVPRRYGRIINIGSVTSVFGFAGLGPYGASRGGIRQLTMSLADDWGPLGSPSIAWPPAGSRPNRTKSCIRTRPGSTISSIASRSSVRARWRTWRAR
jgi:NAD(P)-dependent dehydrogenase (short-subunit alcohol dehydrogenase family)